LIKKQALFEKLIKTFSFVLNDMTNPEKRFTKKTVPSINIHKNCKLYHFKNLPPLAQKTTKKEEAENLF